MPILQSSINQKMQIDLMSKPTTSQLFINKIYQILENPKYRNLISWNIDGTIFTILNQQSFCEEVLPIYFKHKKIQSFVRQLNIYGFRKIKRQILCNSFRHPLFVRNQPELLKKIKRRVKSKKFYSDSQEQYQKYTHIKEIEINTILQSTTLAKTPNNTESKPKQIQQSSCLYDTRPQNLESPNFPSVEDCFLKQQNLYYQNYLYSNKSLTSWDMPLVHGDY